MSLKKERDAKRKQIDALRKWQGEKAKGHPYHKTISKPKKEVSEPLRKGIPSGIMVKADKRATDPELKFGFKVVKSVKSIDCPMKFPEFDREKHLKSWGYRFGKPVLVEMSPEEYLKLVPTPHPAETEYKMPAIRKRLKKGEMFEDLPFIDVRNGRVVTHEGRHRALALKEIDAQKMPVIVYQRDYDEEEWKDWE